VVALGLSRFQGSWLTDPASGANGHTRFWTTILPSEMTDEDRLDQVAQWAAGHVAELIADERRELVPASREHLDHLWSDDRRAILGDATASFGADETDAQ